MDPHIKNCLVCGKDYRVKPYMIKKAKYCSLSCYWLDKRGKIMSNKGRPLSKEHREKLSGSNANNWRGGISTQNKLERKRVEYGIWRTAVFTRDNYTCQSCSKKGVFLHADHIKPFSLFPELRYAIDNGRTLCVSCHMKTETYGGRLLKYASTN